MRAKIEIEQRLCGKVRDAYSSGLRVAGAFMSFTHHGLIIIVGNADK